MTRDKEVLQFCSSAVWSLRSSAEGIPSGGVRCSPDGSGLALFDIILHQKHTKQLEEELRLKTSELNALKEEFKVLKAKKAGA
jgi:hypothetical protein